MNHIYVDKKSLINDLKNIGIKRGDILCVHSSLRSIGNVDGGANTLIDALLDVVGEGGTILMPVFSYSFVGNKDAQPFDIKNTGSKTGLVTEIFRKRKGTKRSNHPTHSVAASGKLAEELISYHCQTTALGIESPFHKMAKAGGKVLLIGVDFNACSLMHVGEIISEVYYKDIFCWEHLGWEAKAMVHTLSGHVKIIPQSEVPGCSKNFNRIKSVLNGRKFIKEGTIGMANSQLCEAKSIINTIVEVLAESPNFLLCEDKDCPACNLRKKKKQL